MATVEAGVGVVIAVDVLVGYDMVVDVELAAITVGVGVPHRSGPSTNASHTAQTITTIPARATISSHPLRVSDR
jgi:hypothetical protein